MNRFHRWYCRSDRWASRLREAVVPWVVGQADLGDDVLEIGPGPGLTTDLLRAKVPHLTAVEIDPALAASLAARLEGGNVEVLNADATDLPLPDGRFSAAVSFTMLHHVPSADLQDRLLAEARRVLRPGGLFAGSDSTPSLQFRLAHLFDTMVLVDPRPLRREARASRFHRREGQPRRRRLPLASPPTGREARLLAQPLTAARAPAPARPSAPRRAGR